MEFVFQLFPVIFMLMFLLVFGMILAPVFLIFAALDIPLRRVYNDQSNFSKERLK